MPMYQYVCGTCQNEYQLRRPRVDARKKAPCPECGTNGKRQLNIFDSGPKNRS